MRFNLRPYLSNKVVLAMLLAAGPALAFADQFSSGDADPPIGDVASSTAGSHGNALGDVFDEGTGSAQPTPATADAPVAKPQTAASRATQQEPSGVNRYADEMGLP